MSNPAQEEFDALVSRNSKHSSSKHRYDNDSDLDDASTLAPSSIHSSTLSHSKPGKHASSRSMRSARSGKSIRSNKSTSGNSFYQDSSDEDTPEEPKKPSTYYLPQSYHREAMTGPKGVIADAAAFEQEKRGGRNNDQFSRTRDLALPKVQRHGGVSPGPGRKGSDDARALDGIDEDSENEALVRWREQRVRELKGAMHNGARGGRKKYGVLETVDGMGFLEAVEKAGRGATVVVYIYDDQVSAHALPSPTPLTAPSPHSAMNSTPTSPRSPRSTRRRNSSRCTATTPRSTRQACLRLSHIATARNSHPWCPSSMRSRWRATSRRIWSRCCINIRSSEVVFSCCLICDTRVTIYSL